MSKNSSVIPATVVSERGKVSLGDHLDLRNLPLATTPGGKNFALKALHPSDHTIQNTRVPGRTVPSASVTCDMVSTIPVPKLAKSAALVNTPNPLWLGYLMFFDDQGVTTGDIVRFSNAALGAPGVITSDSYSAAFNDNYYSCQASMETVCVTAQSVTVDYVAPALAEQGTITSAQMRVKPKTIQGSTATFSDVTVTSVNVGSDIWVYESMPTSAKLLMATNAYTSKIRDGVYQPLKLGKFRSQAVNDGFVPVSEHDNNANESVWVNATTTTCGFPYYYNTKPQTHNRTYPKPSSDIVGITWFEGFDASTYDVSFRLRWRQCLDVVPVVGGIYAPMAQAPLPPDHTAMTMVREVAGRMKDAYPASYNDLGKLKDIVTKIGKAVIKYADPALDFVSNFIPGANLAALPLKIAGGLMTNAGKAKDDPSRYVVPVVSGDDYVEAARTAAARSALVMSAPTTRLLSGPVPSAGQAQAVVVEPSAPLPARFVRSRTGEVVEIPSRPLPPVPGPRRVVQVQAPAKKKQRRRKKKKASAAQAPGQRPSVIVVAKPSRQKSK